MARALAPTAAERKWCHSLSYHRVALICTLLAANPVLAQTGTPVPDSGSAMVDAVQHAAVRAVNFTQGDLASLRAAQDGFTPEGWRAFMKSLQGFVDDNGAPQYSSEFVPSGPPVILSQSNGALHISIPGALTQRQNQSSTRYGTAALDVEARGTPPKIEHLEQKTCVGLPAGATCR